MAAYLVSTMLVVVLFASSAVAEAPLIRYGIVTNPTGRNVNVRKEPPTVTPFSYKLEPVICSIGIGSKFTVLDELHFLNGEIWYKISAASAALKPQNVCKTTTRLSGWMIGRVKRGWVVAIQNVPFSEAPALPEARPNEEPYPESAASDFSLLVNYASLLLGTVLAVCVIAVQRERSLKFADWFSPLVIFESVLIGVANLAFVLLLLDRYLETSKASLVAQALAVFTTHWAGFVFLGFVLGILLLRFMRFSRS